MSPTGTPMMVTRNNTAAAGMHTSNTNPSSKLIGKRACHVVATFPKKRGIAHTINPANTNRPAVQIHPPPRPMPRSMSSGIGQPPSISIRSIWPSTCAAGSR